MSTAPPPPGQSPTAKRAQEAQGGGNQSPAPGAPPKWGIPAPTTYTPVPTSAPSPPTWGGYQPPGSDLVSRPSSSSGGSGGSTPTLISQPDSKQTTATQLMSPVPGAPPTFRQAAQRIEQQKQAEAQAKRFTPTPAPEKRFTPVPPERRTALEKAEERFRKGKATSADLFLIAGAGPGTGTEIPLTAENLDILRQIPSQQKQARAVIAVQTLRDFLEEKPEPSKLPDRLETGLRRFFAVRGKERDTSLSEVAEIVEMVSPPTRKGQQVILETAKFFDASSRELDQVFTPSIGLVSDVFVTRPAIDLSSAPERVADITTRFTELGQRSPEGIVAVGTSVAAQLTPSRDTVLGAAFKTRAVTTSIPDVLKSAVPDRVDIDLFSAPERVADITTRFTELGQRSPEGIVAVGTSVAAQLTPSKDTVLGAAFKTRAVITSVPDVLKRAPPDRLELSVPTKEQVLLGAVRLAGQVKTGLDFTKTKADEFQKPVTDISKDVAFELKTDPGEFLGRMTGKGIILAGELQAGSIALRGVGLARQAVGLPGATDVAKNLAATRGGFVGRFFGRDLFISKKNYIPAERLFDERSLVSPSYTPSKGLKDSLDSFRRQRVVTRILPPGTQVQVPFSVVKKEFTLPPIIQTSSPVGLAGEKAAVGRKAALGLEDPGIFTNPYGRGSSAPLRVFASEPQSYTLNPAKAFESLFGVPTVTVFTTKGVQRIPRDIINIPGFGALADYQKTVAGRGIALITKRSELAFGTVKPQSFISPTTGKKILEKGSSELEAVIPVGTGFVQKGRDFTVLEGRGINIRGAELLSKEKAREELSKGLKVIEGRTIARESAQLSSSLAPVPTSPLSSVVSRGLLNLSKASKVSSVDSSSFSSQISSSLSSPLSSISSSVSSTDSAVSSSIASSDFYSGSFSLSSPISSPVSSPSTASSPSVSGPSLSSGLSIPSLIPGVTEPSPLFFPPAYAKQSSAASQGLTAEGYDVFVKEKGKYVKVNEEPKPFNRAWNLGAEVTDNTPAATFKLRKSKKRADLQKHPETSKDLFIRRKFDKKEGKKKKYVEKKEFRIDTLGELQGITVKGWLARRQKARSKAALSNFLK